MIYRDDEVVCEFGRFYGEGTNNVGEVRSIIDGLRRAKKMFADMPVSSIEVFSDSQLAVKWGNGEWKVKVPHMPALVSELSRLRNELQAKITWVRGHAGDVGNERADQLAVRALELRKSFVAIKNHDT